MGSAVSKIVFQPPPCSYSDDVSTQFRSKVVFVEHPSDGHKVAVFPLRCPRAKWTFIFSHGNAEDIGIIQEWIFLISQNLKANVYAYDYSGYGLSESNSSESNLNGDVRAVYDYVVEKEGVNPKYIIAFGRSLGTVATLQLAATVPIAGAIVQSPIASAFRVGIPALTNAFSVPMDSFSNVDKISKINAAGVTVFVIHGRLDSVVPFSNGELVYSKLKNRVDPWWIDNADHNNIEALYGFEYLIKISNFLEKLLSSPSRRFTGAGYRLGGDGGGGEEEKEKDEA